MKRKVLSHGVIIYAKSYSDVLIVGSKSSLKAYIR